MAVKLQREVTSPTQPQMTQLAIITARAEYSDDENAECPSHETEILGATGAKHLPLANLALISMVAAGIQFGWALQLSLLTPYIQTLGIEHAFSSFIWLCGPISGLVVQPIVGVWSDKCRSRWGRRRPFILVGALLIIVSVIVIAFSADAGYLLGDSHESCHDYTGFRPRAAFIFTIGFWLLDLSNNTVGGPARALIADLAGPEQLDSANAIVVLWMALGNILGYSAGATGQWHRWFPFLTSRACCEACGNLKGAFLLAVIFLVICTVVTLLAAQETPLPEKEGKHVGDAAPLLFEGGNSPAAHASAIQVITADKSEAYQSNGFEPKHTGTDSNINAHDSPKDHELDGPDEEGSIRPGAVLINLLIAVRQLPSSMRNVFLVMAFCWLSWFPFFLFDTDWMGREVYQGNPRGGDASAAAYEEGVRKGALGLLLNSVVLGISSLFIDPLSRAIGSKYLWAASNFIVFVCMLFTTIITAFAVDVRVVDGQQILVHPQWVKVAALVLFSVLGLPLAITFSVPYSITAELIANSGGGQGLALGILNLAVVLPQLLIALFAGPWDALFGGGNEPAFALAAIFALAGCAVAATRLPQLSRHGYRPAVMHMG